MTNVSIEEVKEVCRLAKIKLSDSEQAAFAKDLRRILAFVEQLKAVNTDNVEPFLSPAAQAMPMREDVVTDGNYPEAIVANAPDAAYNMFAVTKVIE